MRRESRLLLDKACDSLMLSIEVFNRPHDRGRVTSALILLDHSFEMLMKSAILHRGGRIREKRAKETIGFDACVRRSFSDGRIKYLTDGQVLTLQTINGLRDAAQHHLLSISEGQLYIHMQSGVTLFRDIMNEVFNQELAKYLPSRVLPVSTLVPTDLVTLFDSEMSEIKKLLRPGCRRRIEAAARLRPLAILDLAIRGEKGQPSDSDLGRLEKEITSGKQWSKVFEGVAAVEVAADNTGPSLSLRLTKKEGIPIHLVKEGTPGASVVAVQKIDALSFYSLGAKQLADKVNLSMPKIVVIVDYLGLRNDPDCYKEFKIGKSIFKRYSIKAAEKIMHLIEKESPDEIWAKQKEMKGKS